MLPQIASFFSAAVAAAVIVATSSSAALAQSSTRAENDWSNFVGVTDLQALLSSDPAIQVLDIRDEKYVVKGVIPGATWIHYKEWRGPAERPGRAPSEAEMEALLGTNGLRLDQPIVVHNHSGKTIQTGRAAIVYWLLKSAGAEYVAILDGGYKAWDAAALPTAAEITSRPEQTVDVTYRTNWWAGPLDIYGVTTGQVDGAILDARLDSQVRKSIETGEPMMSMPMAQYIPASLFTNPLSDRSISEEGQTAFVAELEGRGIDIGNEFLISVCATGELSALSWFYASEVIGLENVRYYPDALKGWENDGGFMFGMRSD